MARHSPVRSIDVEMCAMSCARVRAAHNVHVRAAVVDRRWARAPHRGFPRVRAVADAANGLGDIVSVDSAAKAGLIVLGVRVAALGLGKAKQGSDVERGTAMAVERGIDCSDLYWAEDAESRWYLIGPWSAPKRGDAKYGAGRMSQEINGRVRYHDAKIKADEGGVKYADIDALSAMYPTTPKKFVELRRRLREAGIDCE
jgi:hypothetical protein